MKLGMGLKSRLTTRIFISYRCADLIEDYYAAVNWDLLIG
jgi:hypothetical protein